MKFHVTKQPPAVVESGDMFKRFLLQFALAGALLYTGYKIGTRHQTVHAMSNQVFELRTYTTLPGKLDDLHKRFREHTTDIFKKHGMTNVGYWVPQDEPLSKNTLIYILGYPSKEAREKSWADFQADPDWKAAKAASEVNGSLVAKVETKFLAPTDYSPIK